VSYHCRRLNGGDLQIGDLLDSRYRIVGLVGQGGMGSVYRAEHVAFGRPVAIKVLHPDFAGDPDHGKRFQREAFVTGRADHPNCVTVSDFGALAAGGFYLVMELVEGIGLGDLLAREERLPARRALHIARHMLRGLAHAHAAGVVHRDIKPSNVILVQSGDDPDFAKLLDFGIAKLVEGTAPSAPVEQHITRIGTAVGTPTYVAPEQAMGAAADPRSDLYSLSIVLFEMIAGLPPFRAEDTVKLLGMHVSSPVPAMAELVPGLCVSPAVEELVGVGLAKDAADRYASAAAYAAAIDDLFARDMVDPPSPAPAATSAALPAPRRASLSPRGRKLVAGAAGALALLIIIIVAAGDRGGAGLGRPEIPGMLVPTGLVEAAPEPDSTAEDARQELALGHDEIAARRPLEALEAYRRAVALDPAVAADPDLRKNAEPHLQARDSKVAAAAVVLLGDMEGDWAIDRLVELAADRRNAVRRSARTLAEKRGAGDRIDRLTSYVLDLLHGKTCEERAEAVPRLRELGDKRAIPALRRARKRKTGGILGLGGRIVNGCMRVELDEAIAYLQAL
jgi:eukaryotic-like serine/threonine-protein kinase